MSDTSGGSVRIGRAGLISTLIGALLLGFSQWLPELVAWPNGLTRPLTVMAAVFLLAGVVFLIARLIALGIGASKPGTSVDDWCTDKPRGLWATVWLSLGLAAVVLVVALNQVGQLDVIKDALRKDTALFLFLYLAIVSIYPLTYVAYRAFGEATHRERMRQDFLLLGLASEDEVYDDVEREYRKHYNPVQFWVFIGIIALTTVVVLFGYVTCPAATAGATGGDNRPAPCNNLLGLTRPEMLSIFFAFLGAYVFSVQELIRRYSTYDLQPQVYAAIAVRMLIAVAIVFVAQVVFTADGSNQGIWAAAAFLIGTFPTQGLQFLSQAGTKAMKTKAPERSPLPLGNLLGISDWHESRLLQMGIDDAENLARADLKRLLLTTQFDAQAIVGWVDQAVLYVKVGTRLQRFRELGIYGNYQAVKTIDASPCPPAAGADDDACKMLIAALNLSDPRQLERLLDNGSFPNTEHIASYYANVSLAAKEHAASGVRKVIAGPLQDLLSGLFDPAAGDQQTTDPDLQQRLRCKVERLKEICRVLPAADTLVWIGMAHQRLGELDLARDAFAKAIVIDPGYATAYDSRGLVLMAQQRLVEAVQDFDRAIALYPRLANARHNRGLARVKTGYLDLAVSDFDGAIELDPRRGETYLQRGMVRWQLGDAAGALKDLEYAELLGVNSAELHATWGSLLLSASPPRTTEAISRFTRAIAQASDEPDLFAARARAYLEDGKLDQSRADYRRALDIMKETRKTPEAETRLAELGADIGLATATAGQPDKAIAFLEAIVNADQAAYRARLYLGTLRYSVGHVDGARRDLQAIVDAQASGAKPRPDDDLVAAASRLLAAPAQP